MQMWHGVKKLCFVVCLVRRNSRRASILMGAVKDIITCMSRSVRFIKHQERSLMAGDLTFGKY